MFWGQSCMQLPVRTYSYETLESILMLLLHVCFLFFSCPRLPCPSGLFVCLSVVLNVVNLNLWVVLIDSVFSCRWKCLRLQSLRVSWRPASTTRTWTRTIGITVWVSATMTITWCQDLWRIWSITWSQQRTIILMYVLIITITTVNCTFFFWLILIWSVSLEDIHLHLSAQLSSLYPTSWPHV